MQIDPRQKIDAFYSSIVTSSLDKNTLAKYLEIISKADVLFGKIMKTQNWRLLRYLNETLLELYKNDDRIRYSKYNLSWPLLNRIRWDGRKIKSLSLLLAQKLHLSRSSFSTIGLPYVLFCIKNNQLELELEETFGDIIEKEMELIK
jgi:replication factor C large subunit